MHKHNLAGLAPVPQLLFSLALIFLALSKPALASQAGIPCDDGKRYYGLAQQAGAAQDFDKAADWLQKSITACDSYAAWHLLGTAYQKQRRLEDALAAYEQATLHATRQDQAALSMARYGQVLALNGQRFEALTMLERAIEAHPNPPSWMRENARELDQSLVESPISSDAIKRSLATQQFGLLAMNAIEGQNGPQQQEKATVRIPINYKLDSVEMDELTGGNIDELGKVLSSADYADKTFTLVGHTDVRGSWDHNLTLSQQRADAARQVLERRYPSLQGRLRVTGAGEARPKYPGERLPEADHRLNRRLEVIVN
ncbi:OmpA family protein [Parahaliea mediterranea]|uniref:OmpA family protein n=1 Tax=Parahaliea mediterranea TaxID=651086 RepID=UPI0013004D1C|nr:OmpA family protein [Parahaliea mediterranea]